MHLSRVLLPLGVALLACTSEDSQTPECADVESCNLPAICAEAPDDPIQCCKDSQGKQFQGSDLDLCLIGFGEPPIGGVGGAGTGGTATGGTSAGGGGAAPGGAGGAGGTGGA